MAKPRNAKERAERELAISAATIRANLFPRRYLDPAGTILATAEQYDEARYEELIIEEPRNPFEKFCRFL